MGSQMVDARVLRTSIEISGGANGETAVFSASGKVIEFAGSAVRMSGAMIPLPNSVSRRAPYRNFPLATALRAM